MSQVTVLTRTIVQFVYFLSVLTAVPSLGLLVWIFLDTTRFLGAAPLGISIGEYASAAAVSTVTANAVAFLRPDDMDDWMTVLALMLLLAFGGLMLLLFVLPF